MKISYTYSDIGLVPREKSTIEHREEVNPRTTIHGLELRMPMIAAPMRTVCGEEMCSFLAGQKIFSFLPRNSDINTTLKAIESLKGNGEHLNYIGASIGVTNDYLDQFKQLISAGIKIICIDVANGYHSAVERAVKSIRDWEARFPNKTYLVTGNVASVEGFCALESWGVDAIRCNIGSGAVCITSTATGVGQGAVSVMEEVKQYYAGKKRTAKLICDGGIREPGDMAKAISMGADYVMVGSVFAGTRETPGAVIKHNGVKYKVYAGEASLYAQGVNEYVEGEDTLVQYKGKASDIVKQYEQGLRSAMAYLNCRTITELQNISDNSIVLLSQNARFERTAHLLARPQF